jgi:hypothetical protein
MIEQQPEDKKPSWSYERQSVLCEGTRNDRHQNVISRQYSPQEIENSNVEILHNVQTKQH